MVQFIDETGNRYGRLVVINREANGKRNAYWLCRCDCGNTHIVKGATLREGTVRSCGCLARLKTGEASFNQMYGRMKRAASKRNLVWDLSEEQVKEITKKDCFYCGKPPQQRAGTSKFYGYYVYNGIDRVDNHKGYTVGNVVPCCGACNTSKSNLSISEFKEMILNIYYHWINPEC